MKPVYFNKITFKYKTVDCLKEFVSILFILIGIKEMVFFFKFSNFLSLIKFLGNRKINGIFFKWLNGLKLIL